MTKVDVIHDLLKRIEKELLEDWMKAQLASITFREDLMSVEDLRKQSIEFLRELVKAVSKGNFEDISKPEYEKITEMLRSISKSRTVAGYTPSETSTYIFSLKESLFTLLQREYSGDPQALNMELIRLSKLLDKLGLVTFETFTQSREEIINEQRKSILELSSPIVTLWDKILAVPVIGILDSKRTQQVMEDLLQTIVATGSRVAIIDITGVSVMDTLVANHLMKTASAVKLLGAETVITGIRPEVAQTIVHLGVDLSDLVTRSSMAAGLVYAFNRLGLRVTEK